MALSESKISDTKVPFGRNQFKVSDGGGLYLLVKSSGRYWKLAYRFDGKQKTLAFGVYPSVSLDEARLKREEAKALLAQNIDPGLIKKKEKLERKIAVQQNTTTTLQQQHVHEARPVPKRQPVVLEEAEQKKLELRRLAILKVIAESNAYAVKENALHQQLEEHGFRISFDRLRTDIAWLYEQQVVHIENDDQWLVQLTQPGLDVVHGRMWIPGIQHSALE
ncbi:MAG: Arm DNA-binding domain-containing protein [Mariprofundus sp.]|nr:Arm DNA-binding domain-containing protein [Mariprofundus sp.]